jgi:type II secretory pathway pseudopilin PulG
VRCQSERGFTLVEVVVAAAIAFVLGWALIALAHAIVANAAHLDARLTARSATDRLAERLQSDAASAWSVYVPGNDVFGASNADGHELDFATENASRQQIWWAYTYDAASQRVTEHGLVPNGARTDGETFDGITAFASETHPVSDLAVASSDVFDPLFAASSATPVDVDYGWTRKAAVGGNHLVRVHLAALGVDRALILSSATAPTHFTVILDYTPPP